MTQTEFRASHIGGRLFKSAATSALALSAVAGGVMLSGGEAKAVACNGTPLTFTDTNLNTSFTNTCTLEPAGSTLSGVTPTFIRIGNDPMYPNVQTTVDFDNLSQQGSSDIRYHMREVSPAITGITGFDRVQLRWEPPAAGSFTILKSVYSDPAYQNLIGTISTNGGTLPINPHLPNIYVKDEVTLSGGAFVPGINNDFRNVPGPLPILGAGAAFGFSRKLRSRIKAARTA
jgi:hypothetical protein